MVAGAGAAAQWAQGEEGGAGRSSSSTGGEGGGGGKQGAGGQRTRTRPPVSVAELRRALHACTGAWNGRWNGGGCRGAMLCALSARDAHRPLATTSFGQRAGQALSWQGVHVGGGACGVWRVVECVPVAGVCGVRARCWCRGTGHPHTRLGRGGSLQGWGGGVTEGGGGRALGGLGQKVAGRREGNEGHTNPRERGGAGARVGDVHANSGHGLHKFSSKGGVGISVEL